MNPTQTLSSLKSFHSQIRNQISDILECARDYTKAQGLLSELELVLGAYFGTQDEDFYQWLSDNTDLGSKLVNFLSDDLQGLKVEFLEFRDQYPLKTSDIRIRNFPRDFHAFSKRIFARFAAETDQVLPKLGVNK